MKERKGERKKERKREKEKEVFFSKMAFSVIDRV